MAGGRHSRASKLPLRRQSGRPETGITLAHSQSVVATLRGTDLSRLIERCERREPPVVYVSRHAVVAWEKRAPTAWTAAREWFDAHEVLVVTI